MALPDKLLNDVMQRINEEIAKARTRYGEDCKLTVVYSEVWRNKIGGIYSVMCDVPIDYVAVVPVWREMGDAASNTSRVAEYLEYPSLLKIGSSWGTCNSKIRALVYATLGGAPQNSKFESIYDGASYSVEFVRGTLMLSLYFSREIVNGIEQWRVSTCTMQGVGATSTLAWMVELKETPPIRNRYACVWCHDKGGTWRDVKVGSLYELVYEACECDGSG